MLSVRLAEKEDIRTLSAKLLQLLRDHGSQVYRENVAKFGIPDDYVKGAFGEEALLQSYLAGLTVFYLALEDDEIVGFAQTVQEEHGCVELDRIIVFPESTRQGIGTQLLQEAIIDQKKRGTNTITVSTGSKEEHAKSFYEKNGFHRVGEQKVKTPWGKMISLVSYKLDL